MVLSWKHIKYFKPEEFADPHYGGSGENIDGILLFELEKLRKDTGWAIIPHGKVGGCVDIDGRWGHSLNSYHLFKNGCKACDWHFADPKTFEPLQENPRIQYKAVEEIGFPGIGVYYWWHWNGILLPIGFHTDLRPASRLQRWVSKKQGEYMYFLGRENA